MANLTGQPINTSYAGLIKTADNAGIDGTFKQLTDGLGTNIPIEVSNADLRILSNQIQLTDVAQTNGFSITDLTMAFGGAVDFSAATVTGLPGGAGLVEGTGPDAMASAATLTTTAAIASGERAIALGEGVIASAYGNTAIGDSANAGGTGFATAIGRLTNATGISATSVGNNASATGAHSVAIGSSATASSQASIGIGNTANGAGFEGIAMGNNASSDGNFGIALGASSEAGVDTISIGRQAGNSITGQPGTNSVNLGHFAHATGADAVAIGSEATALQTGAVAIGADVDANIAQTVSIKALEVQTDSTPTTGGIIISDAGGTDRRINIDATGALQIDSTPVGGGGAAGLVNGTGINSLKSADDLAAVANVASGEKSIAIGNDNEADDYYGVAIGNESAAGNSTIAIGNRANWNTPVDQAVVIGNTSNAATRAVAIGRLANASAVDSFAMGNEAAASATGAAAIGAGVTAAIADTASVKALEVQTDSTPTAGGIIMSDAGGIDRRINIDATGALQVDSTPVGGGGGGIDSRFMQNPAFYAPQFSSNGNWNMSYFLSGYTTSGAKSMTANDTQFVPFYATAGEIINNFYFRVQTAQPGATMKVGLYKAYSYTVGGVKYTAPEFVATIATGVDVSTTGKKQFTGIDILLPTDAIGGQYFIGFISDTTAVQLTKWSNTIAYGNIASDIYRINGFEVQQPDFNLPIGQIATPGASGTTDLAVDLAWQYKA